LHKRRNIHELSSATMLVSLKLASKDLVLDHQIDKTGTKPLICTGVFKEPPLLSPFFRNPDSIPPPSNPPGSITEGLLCNIGAEVQVLVLEYCSQ